MKQLFILLRTYAKLLFTDPKKALQLTNFYNIKRFFSAIFSESKSEVLDNASSFLENVTPIITPDAADPTTHELEVVKKHIDTSYYQNHYGIKNDHAIHYCEKGWKKGFNPSPSFNTKYYLTSNPDVKGALINPYYHFLVQGVKEGRHPTIPGGVMRTELIKSASMKEREKNWKGSRPGNIVDSATLYQKLKPLKGAFILSASHDNFKENPGGVQLCIKREYTDALDSGSTYLHISPLAPKLTLQLGDDNPHYLRLFINDEKVMSIKDNELLDCLEKCGVIDLLTIHSVLGFRDNFIASLVKSKARTKLFWMHDFSSCCVNFNLMRNGISFCGGPDIDSPGCSVCIDNADRRAYLPVIRRIIENKELRFICPSSSTRAVVERVFPEIKHRISVHPHLILKQKALEAFKPNKKIKIAFCGSAMYLKGWRYFVALADHLYGDFEFFHFSSVKEPIPIINHVSTTIAGSKSMMTERLKEHNIDFVFIGSVCSETFSFSAHEAISAGCFLLNLGKHGNIPYLISESNGIGKNYETLNDIIKDAQSGILRQIVDVWQKEGRLYRDFDFSRFSLDIIEAG